MSSADLKQYYARRAAEYESIYHRPERQQDLAKLKNMVSELLRGQRILEIACGTGYWTEALAPVAQSILATDANIEVLQIAKTKHYPPGRVVFALADAYDLAPLPGEFTAALAAFWWSHVPRQDIYRFVRGLHQRLGDGATVVLVDNRYVEGNSTPIAERDEHGNTYQLRTLTDGSRHRVLKNFPSAAELQAALHPHSGEVAVSELDYYWCASYRVKGATA